MDLDLDSPSSCVTASSTDSEDDDLCSIDDTDLTDDLERSEKLELEADDGNSEFGRVSHVSCSVDESSDEDEVYLVSLPLLVPTYLLIEQKRFRSTAPSPPVLAPPPIVQGIFSNVQQPVNVLGPPRSAAVRMLNSNVKVERAELVISGMVSISSSYEYGTL